MSSISLVNLNLTYMLIHEATLILRLGVILNFNDLILSLLYRQYLRSVKQVASFRDNPISSVARRHDKILDVMVRMPYRKKALRLPFAGEGYVKKLI